MTLFQNESNLDSKRYFQNETNRNIMSETLLETSEDQAFQDSCGVIVGRFQADEITDGHRDLIKSVMDKHVMTILVLGIAIARSSKENPLDFETRRMYFAELFPELRIVPLENQRTDSLWSKKLNEVINKNLHPGGKAVLYGSRDSFISHYEGSRETRELLPTSNASATRSRRLTSFKPENSASFRRGVIYATQNQYDTTYSAVDIAIVRQNSAQEEILLGRKPGENKFRFIGGFVDPKKSGLRGRFFEANAMRETDEESECSVTDLRYRGTYLMDDWRYRGESDKISSTLFEATFDAGEPKAADDIEEVKWFNLHHFSNQGYMAEHLEEVHYQLMEELLERKKEESKIDSGRLKEIELLNEEIKQLKKELLAQKGQG